MASIYLDLFGRVMTVSSQRGGPLGLRRPTTRSLFHRSLLLPHRSSHSLRAHIPQSNPGGSSSILYNGVASTASSMPRDSSKRNQGIEKEKQILLGRYMHHHRIPLHNPVRDVYLCSHSAHADNTGDPAKLPLFHEKTSAKDGIFALSEHKKMTSDQFKRLKAHVDAHDWTGGEQVL